MQAYGVHDARVYFTALRRVKRAIGRSTSGCARNASLATRSTLQLACTRRCLHDQLCRARTLISASSKPSPALHRLSDKLESLKKLASAITDAISNVRPLLEAGARADVLLPSTLVAVRLPEIQSSAMEMLCKVPALAALLKLVLEETKEKALNVNFSWMCDNFSGRPQLVSPMGMAAHHHNVAAMHLLLKHGCDPRLPCAVTNLRDEIFYPLHYAAWDLRNENATLPQLVEVAEALVAHGADVNAKSIPYGRSALHLGIMALRPVNERKAGIPVDESLGAVVLWLLDHGADVHAIREDTRERPLDMALVRGAIYVCDALLAHGADPHPVPFIGGIHGEFLNAGLHYLDLAISADLVDVLRFAAKAGVKLEKVMSSGFIHLPLLSAALEAHTINCATYLLVEYRPRDRNPRPGDDARNSGAGTAEAAAEQDDDDDDEGVGVDLNVPFHVPPHLVGVPWTEHRTPSSARSCTCTFHICRHDSDDKNHDPGPLHRRWGNDGSDQRGDAAGPRRPYCQGARGAVCGRRRGSIGGQQLREC